MVGLVRFELTTSCTPCKRATRLRYSPNRRRVTKRHGRGRGKCFFQTDRNSSKFGSIAVFSIAELQNEQRQTCVSEARRISKYAWIWPCLLAATIFVISGRAAVGGPKLFEGIDKVAHFFVYGLLATLIVRLSPRPAAAWWAWLAASLYGVSDEWHQSFTPGRSVELADLIADSLGALVAVVVYRHWHAYRRWLERSIVRKRRIEKPGDVAPVSQP